jgi:hypothetical protein
VFPELQEALHECRSPDMAFSPVWFHSAVNYSAGFSSLQGKNKLYDRNESCFRSARVINGSRHYKTPIVATVHALQDMFQSCNDGLMHADFHS